MKIRVLRPVDYRVKPAVIQVFRPGIFNVPRKTAQALIDAGAAEPIQNPNHTKDADHG